VQRWLEQVAQYDAAFDESGQVDMRRTLRRLQRDPNSGWLAGYRCQLSRAA